MNLREAVIQAAGHAPVQGHEPDCRVCPYKTGNIVGYGITDPAVGASFPRAGSDHIPERNSLFGKAQGAFRIGKVCRDSKKFFHDRPEPVLFVPVIFTVCEGEDARETAEDND